MITTATNEVVVAEPAEPVAMFKVEPTFEEGVAKLRAELANPRTPTASNPKVLNLKDIHFARAVFQPRSLNYQEDKDTDERDLTRSGRHIETLIEAIKSSSTHTLDAITVFWSGTKYRVIDGHHRLDAYRGYSRECCKGRDIRIPVRVLKGTLKEAIAESRRGNAKDKLVMTKDDKMESAWRMVLSDFDWSKMEIANICKVSTGSPARMRARLKLMSEEHPEDYLEIAKTLSWKDAGSNTGEIVVKEWSEKVKEQWKATNLRAMYNTFGSDRLAKQPELFLEVLEQYSPSLVENFIHLLRERIREQPDF